MLSNRIVNKVLTRLAQVLGRCGGVRPHPVQPGGRQEASPQGADRREVVGQAPAAHELAGGSRAVAQQARAPAPGDAGGNGAACRGSAQPTLGLLGHRSRARSPSASGRPMRECGSFVLRPALRDELALYRDKAEAHGPPGAFVFPTATGRKDEGNNVRRRLLVKAAERANVRLGKLGIEPIGTVQPAQLAADERHAAEPRGRACEASREGDGPRLEPFLRLTSTSRQRASASGSTAQSWRSSTARSSGQQWAQLGTSDVVTLPAVAHVEIGEQAESRCPCASSVSGACRDRTGDLRLAKPALYQLS